MYAHRGCVGVYEYPEVGLKNDVLVDPFPPLCEATKSSPPPGVLYRLPPQRRSHPRAVGASPCVVSEWNRRAIALYPQIDALHPLAPV